MHLRHLVAEEVIVGEDDKKPYERRESWLVAGIDVA